MAAPRAPRPRRSPAPPQGRGSIYEIRLASGLRLRERIAVQVHRDELVHDLEAIDAELLALSARRRNVVGQLARVRDRLYPPVPWTHGRRPPDLDVAPLPPAAEGAVALTGRPLRAACRAILRRHGPTSLRELHGLLHRYGYLVGSPRPVAALSDAMRHEVRADRARRVERGVYELREERDPSRARRDEPELLPAAELIARFRTSGPTPLDPALDADPSSWCPAPEPLPAGVPPGGHH